MNIKQLNEQIEKILNEENNRPNLASFTFKNYLNSDGQNYKGRETYASTLRSVLEEIERLYNKVKTNYAGGTTPQEQFKNHCENIWKHSTVRNTLSLNDSSVRRQPGLASAIKALHNYQQSLTNDLANLNKWDGKEWVNELNEEIDNLLTPKYFYVIGDSEVNDSYFSHDTYTTIPSTRTINDGYQSKMFNTFEEALNALIEEDYVSIDERLNFPERLNLEDISESDCTPKEYDNYYELFSYWTEFLKEMDDADVQAIKLIQMLKKK